MSSEGFRVWGQSTSVITRPGSQGAQTPKLRGTPARPPVEKAQQRGCLWTGEARNDHLSQEITKHVLQYFDLTLMIQMDIKWNAKIKKWWIVV